MQLISVFIVVSCLLKSVETAYTDCNNCGCCVDEECSVYDGKIHGYCNKGCIDGIFGDRCYNPCPENCAACERNGKHIHGVWTHHCTKCPDGKYLSTDYTCNTVETVHPGCENCGCCIDRECSVWEQMSDYCYKGCIDGIYGDKCYNPCPGNCAACERNVKDIYGVLTHDCTKCTDGKYLSHAYKDCSLICPSQCKTCTSDTVCTECYAPYFNYGTTTNCSLYCPTNCKMCSESGLCLTCKEGFYSPKYKCTSTCPSSCQSCLSFRNCPRCKAGYYNGKELDIHSNVVYNDCRLFCRISCLECSSYNVCLSCVNGTYGSYCENTCSAGCRYGSCEKNTGNCDCRYGFTGQQCDECKNGKYGTNCDKECSHLCKNNICHKSNGQCRECVTDYFTDTYCRYCIDGRYGRNCSLNCPKNCKNYSCTRESGDCSIGCNDNYMGTKCDKCKTGKHGENCSLECPKNCQNKYCYQDSGACYSCEGNFKGAKCDECKDGFYQDECSKLCRSSKCFEKNCHRTYGSCTRCPKGYYGELCEKQCSYGCSSDSCDIDTGVCSYGCQPGFSGDRCCARSSNCELCQSNSKCLTCKKGHYSADCELECPGTCIGNCDKTSGICEICPPNMFGSICNYSCPISCKPTSKHRICNFSTGYCLFGCQDGLHGLACEYKCSHTCEQNKCDQITGQCLTDCVDGFQGLTSSKDKSSSWNAVLSNIGSAAGGMMVTASLVAVMLGLRRWKSKRIERFREREIADTELQSANQPTTNEDLNRYQSLDPNVRDNRGDYSTVDTTGNVYEHVV